MKQHLIFISILFTSLGWSQTTTEEVDSVLLYSKEFDSLFIQEPETAFLSLKRIENLSRDHQSLYAQATLNFQLGRYYLDKSISDSARINFEKIKSPFQEDGQCFQAQIN